MARNCCKHIIPTKLTVASVLLLSVLLLSGCGGGSAVVPDEPERPVEMSKESFVTIDLRISVNDGDSPNTRAFNPKDDGPFDDPANDNDYEKVHTLRVVIVRADGTIEHNRMVTVRDNYGDVIGSGDIVNDNLQFKVAAGEDKFIYLFANEKAVNRNKSADDQFDFTANLKTGSTFPTDQIEKVLIKRDPNKAFIDNGSSMPLAEKSYIPMSEWFKVTVPAASGNVAEEFHTVEDLFLTRSLIKFSFSVALSGENLYDTQMTLRGVRISNLANSGYYLPNKTIYDPPKYEPSTLPYYGRRITQFDVPMDAAHPVEKDYSDCIFLFDESLPLTKAGVDRNPLIYLPESKLFGEENNYKLTLLFSDPKQDELYESKPLQFRLDDILKNTKDIPRNTHVKVNISLTTHSMQATVTLFPYTAVNLNPEFGFKVDVEEVTLTEEDGTPINEDNGITIKVGKSNRLIATVTPDEATDKNIEWRVLNTKVATVDYSGLVSAASVGETTVRALATDGSGKYKDCKVTVVPTTNLTLAIGQQFSVTGWMKGEEATYKDIIWTSSDPNVAEVTDFGLVTAKSEGTAILTAPATATTPAYSCTVTVGSKVPVTEVILSEPELKLEVSKIQRLTASVEPSNATDKNIDWKSLIPKVASVTYYGSVRGISVGIAYISATAADGSGTSNNCKVTVIPMSTLTLEVDKEGTITGWNNVADATENLNWTSDKQAVATVTDFGLVTAHGVGTATITDRSGNYEDCTVTVIPMSYLTLEEGKSKSISGNTAIKIDWVSSDQTVATVDDSGLVTAKSAGTATITDKSGKYEDCTVIVTAKN